MSQHAAHIAQDHCLAPERVSASAYGGRYRPLFEDLPALEVDEQALHALGGPGGLCDLGVDFGGDADSESSAVWPFFGQFIAHDITADRSPLGHRADPARSATSASPGPTSRASTARARSASPYLYSKDDPAKLLLSPTGRDVPRNHEGIALIGDPRNDVHLFTSQMSVAFIKLHNRLVDRLRATGVAEEDVFEEARRAATLALPARDPARVPAGPHRRGADRRAARRTARSCIASTATPTSRSSSPTPRTATATPRSATATRSTSTSARARCSRPHGLRRGPARAHRRLDPADRRRGPRRRRSVPSASTRGCPPP